MTSFGWKRKIGERVSKKLSTDFDKNAADEEDEAVTSGEVDWLHLVPKRRAIQLEDGVTKANRLRHEGTVLAGGERYWEALQKWDEALLYNPSDEALYEMRAQAYMQVGEVLPAIQSAKKSVYLKPQWWVSHQTLGRAFLGVGEIRMALRSFSKAVHINPVSEELWEEDLRWALSLCKQSDATKEEQKLSEERSNAARIVELDEEGFCKTVGTISRATTSLAQPESSASISTVPGASTSHRQSESWASEPSSHRGRRKPPRQGETLPLNYVRLRD